MHRNIISPPFLSCQSGVLTDNFYFTGIPQKHFRSLVKAVNKGMSHLRISRFPEDLSLFQGFSAIVLPRISPMLFLPHFHATGPTAHLAWQKYSDQPWDAGRSRSGSTDPLFPPKCKAERWVLERSALWWGSTLRCDKLLIYKRINDMQSPYSLFWQVSRGKILEIKL